MAVGASPLSTNSPTPESATPAFGSQLSSAKDTGQLRVDAALLDVAGLVLLRVAREEVLEVAVGLEADSVAVVESGATADSDGAASRRVSRREQDATSEAADTTATAARAVRWGRRTGRVVMVYVLRPRGELVAETNEARSRVLSPAGNC